MAADPETVAADPETGGIILADGYTYPYTRIRIYGTG